MNTDTIAAVATGAQVAAIGIIRLSGPDAISIADRLFFPARGGRMSENEDRKLVYGRLCTLDGALLDLCMCTISRAPHSYTGENTAELQCHGSPVVLRTALEEIFSLGARQAGPGEFTKRAFLSGRMELSSAEAVADIIDAETAESAKNAAGQLSGAVFRRTEGVYSLLADISSHFHAVLDYPDEDIEDFRMAQYTSDLTAAKDDLAALLATFSRGRLMNSGIPAAIVGRPNAGKSSLLNALLGYERAIVTDVPGVLLRLPETAGIRDTGDAVERLGVERSRRAMEAAELVLAVVDGSRPVDDEDMRIIHAAERAPHALLVVSKRDIAQGEVSVDAAMPRVYVSALTGEGLDELQTAVRDMFPLPAVPAGEILTNARQADAVSRALEYITAALDAMNVGATPDIVLTEAEGAMQALGELSGRSVREDVTDRIFSRFCVGK